MCNYSQRERGGEQSSNQLAAELKLTQQAPMKCTGMQTPAIFEPLSLPLSASKTSANKKG